MHNTAFGGYGYDTYDYLRLSLDDAQRTNGGRIAIVGLPGAGKKTLCNSLWGWDAVQPSRETTRNFGLVTLIDLPLDAYDAASVLYRLENMDLIVFVLDGEQGLEADGFNWIARLRGLDAAMLIVLNKVDRIPADKRQSALDYLETRTARPVVPVSAVSPPDVRDNLLSAILQMCPDLAVPLATEIPALRRTVALHTVMQGVMTSLTLNLEINARNDSSVLVGLQIRLIRQVAAIYGYREKGGVRQRIGLSVVLRWLIHTAIKQTARLQQLEGRIGGSVVSALSTFVVGHGAIIVYGGNLPRWLVRYTPQGWRSHQSNGQPDVKP